MKWLAVCGFGVGSSMILRLSLEKVCKELGVDVEIENTDLSGARGTPCDVIFTSAELLDELKGLNKPIYAVKKYMDLDEVRIAVKKFMSQ